MNEKNELIACWHKLEHFSLPAVQIGKETVELTGIRDEMIANAPDVETAVRGFLDFCGGWMQVQVDTVESYHHLVRKYFQLRILAL